MPKNRYKQLEKVFSIPLGARCREFESPTSDQINVIRICFREEMNSDYLFSLIDANRQI